MRIVRYMTFVLSILLISVAFAQEQPAARATESDATDANTRVTLPAGTKVLLVMKNSVSSRNARPGDGVYLQSTFPVVAEGRVLIPAGTFVQGIVDEVKRSGRVKGRAELLLHFTTLIYPNGYMVSMPGSLESSDSSDTQRVKDKEGTVQAEGGKGKDAAAIATATGTGALVGGLSRGGKGALVGGAIGGAVGIATALLTRGEEVRLENGSSVEMVLTRPLDLDTSRIDGTNQVPAPPVRPRNKMEKIPLTPSPSVNGVPIKN